MKDLLKENEELRALLQLWEDGTVTRVKTIEKHVELLNDQARLDWLLDKPTERMAKIKRHCSKNADRGITYGTLREALRASIDALRDTQKLRVRKEVAP